MTYLGATSQAEVDAVHDASARFPLPWRRVTLRSRWLSPYEKGIGIRAANDELVVGWWDDDPACPSDRQIECIVTTVNRHNIPADAFEYRGVELEAAE